MWNRIPQVLLLLALQTAGAVDSFTCVENTGLMSSDILSVENVETLKACEEFCAKTDICQAFVYTKSQECALKDEVGTSQSADGSTSCTRQKDIAADKVVAKRTAGGFECEIGSYVGQDFFYIENISTLEACQDHCTQISGCVSLTYASNTCTLYDKLATFDESKKSHLTCKKTQHFKCAEGMKFGNPLFAIGDVASLEECQNQCVAFAVCGGINYGQDKSCELVSSTDGAEGEVSSTACAVILKNAEKEAVKPVVEKTPKEETTTEVSKVSFSCRNTATLEGADLVSFGNVATVAECQQYCLSVSLCRGFIYSGDECQLKPVATFIETEERKEVACLMDTPTDTEIVVKASEYQCAETTYVGGDIKVAANYDEDSCRDLCSSSDECAVFMYLGDKTQTCTLKSSTATELSADSAAVPMSASGVACKKKIEDSKSSPVPLPEHFLHEVRLDVFDYSELFSTIGMGSISGTPIKHISAVSQERCMAQCQVNDKCEYAAFSSSHGCQLLDESTAIIEDETSHFKIWSKKPSDTAEGYQCSRGAYVGGTISIIHGVSSLSECARECTSTKGCVVVVYHAGDSRCALKALHAVETKDVVELSTACVSNDIRKSEEFKCSEKVSYGEGSISLVEDISSIEDCMNACKGSSDCVFVQFMAQRKACELKGSSAVAESGIEGIVSCSREDVTTDSRSVQTLQAAGQETEPAVSFVKVKVSFSIDRLTPSVWSSQELPAAISTSNPTDIVVTTRVRVPVGLLPVLYATSVHHALSTELMRQDNMFVTKLNPTLRHLGLNPIVTSDSKSGWEVSNNGFDWTQTIRMVKMPVVLSQSSLESVTERLQLARDLANAMGVSASVVSILEIFQCSDPAGTQNCERIWESASPESAAGRRVSTLQAGGNIKVITTFDLPAGMSKFEYCIQLVNTLQVNTFGVRTAADCEQYRDDTMMMGDSPVDSPLDDMTQSDLSRRLLSIKTATSSRGVNPLQSNAGTKTGHRRSCSDGWKGDAYGVMSNSFNVNAGAEVTGTLIQCIDKCVQTESCYAFSRDRSLADTQEGTCWLKKTVMPVVGDQYKHDGLETYVVSCPPETDPCKWYHMQNVDISGTADSEVAVKPIVTSSECSSLCELIPDCIAVSYRMEDHSCTFIKSLPKILRPSDGFLSSVCYRVSLAKTPCDEGICGINPENDCFPLLGDNGVPTHRCICADGFKCDGVCDAEIANNCIRSDITLQTLFTEALENILGLDKLAYEMLSVENVDSGVPATVSNSNIVVSTAKVYVPTKHIVHITFSKTDSADLVGEKLNALRSSITSGLLLSPEKISVQSLCHVLPSGEIAACFNEQQDTIEVPVRPLVKVSPSDGWSSAKSWCTSEGEKMATPKNSVEVAQLIEDAYGEMTESRRYWAGARCTAEDCTDAANWQWEDSLETVDWQNLAFGNDLSILSKGDCAVFQWDPVLIRWALNAEKCNYKKAFPVCQESSSPDASRAEECNSQACDLRVTFAIELKHVRSIHFYTIADSMAKRYNPSVDFTPGTKIVDADGNILGYVDALGKTKAIPYPPVDEPTNPILLKMTGYKYLSERLRAFLSSQIADFVDKTVGLTTEYNNLCHVSTEQQHLRCDTACTLVNPLLVQRTSCKGAPLCSAIVACSGHGTVKGYIGHCTCACDVGFTGTDCAQCAAGYDAYPMCLGDNGGDAVSPSPDLNSDADPLFEVFHIFFKSGSGRIESSLIEIRNGVSSALSDVTLERTVRYVCPINVCLGSDICRTATIASWISSKRSQCTIVDTDPQQSESDRDASTLQGGQIWDIDDAESVLEVSVKYNGVASATGTAVTADAIRRITSESLFTSFEVINAVSVYGPSATRDQSEIIDDNLNVSNKSMMAPVIIEKETSMVTFIAIAASVAACLLAIIGFLLFKMYQRNKWTEEETTTGKAIFQEFGSSVENFEDDDDRLVISKDADEPMGILWDDHTLLVDVAHGSAASRYNADRYRDRRVAQVNGVPVSRLAEIKAQVTGKTIVVLDFEPLSVPITVVVDQSPESLDESFIDSFAAKISDALDLQNFTSVDIDLQSVTGSLDKKNQSHVSMNLIGLTSAQISEVVRLCKTPGSVMCAGPTSIVNAYVEEQDNSNAVRNGTKTQPPRRGSINPVWVYCQWVAGAAEAAGCYIQAVGTEIAGQPVWRNRNLPDEHWIYSADGYWIIVDDAGMSDNATETEWIMKSAHPHNGSLPSTIKSWITKSGSTEAEKHIIVAMNEVRAQEFVVGQRVVFPDSVQLGEQGVVITAKSEGIIMGNDEEGLVKVFLLNEAGDYVIVSTDVLDSPDGPKCLVLHKSASDDLKTWMAATIVKARGDLIKVTFDCTYCDAMWIDIVNQSDIIKMKQEREFSVDAVVLLDSAYTPSSIDSIQHGESGTIIAVNPGQAMPYLVQGMRDACWYPGDVLVLENETSSTTDVAYPYGFNGGSSADMESDF